MSESGGISEADLAVFHDVVGRLRALPVDDPVRLRAEQVAAFFARDGRLRRRKAQGARGRTLRRRRGRDGDHRDRGRRPP